MVERVASLKVQIEAIVTCLILSASPEKLIITFSYGFINLKLYINYLVKGVLSFKNHYDDWVGVT